MFNVTSFWVGVNVGIAIAAIIWTIPIIYLIHRYEILERKMLKMEVTK